MQAKEQHKINKTCRFRCFVGIHTNATKVKNIKRKMKKKKMNKIVQYHWLSGLDLSYAWQFPTFTYSLQSHLMYNLLEVFFCRFFENCWEKCLILCMLKRTSTRVHFIKWLYDVVERSRMEKMAKKSEPLNGNESFFFWILKCISLWQRLKIFYF